MAAKTCGKPTASGGRCQKPIGPAGTCGADHKAPTALATIANIAATGSADPMAGQQRPREPERPGGGFDTGLIEVMPGNRAEAIAERYGLALNNEHRGTETGYHVDVSHLTREQVAGALARHARGEVEVLTGDDEVSMVGDYDAIVATAHAATEELHADNRALHTAQGQANHEGHRRPDDDRVGRATLPAIAQTTGSGSLFKRRFPIGARVEIIPSPGAEPVVGTMAWGTDDYHLPGKPHQVIVVEMEDDNGSSFTVNLDKPSRANSPDWQVRELATA